jgi:uncharacterized protein YqgV (UPF0045/DUF77 family)
MIAISAQVSVYPLRQPRLSPTIDETVRILGTHAQSVFHGPMSTCVTGDDEDIFAALKEALRDAAARGDFVMVVTISNACPASS